MRVSSTETLIAYSYNTVLTLDRVDLWHSMPHLGLSSAIQKLKFPGAFRHHNCRYSRFHCCVTSAQHKAVRLLKWDPQGFDGLEAIFIPALPLVCLSDIPPCVR